MNTNENENGENSTINNPRVVAKHTKIFKKSNLISFSNFILLAVVFVLGTYAFLNLQSHRLENTTIDLQARIEKKVATLRMNTNGVKTERYVEMGEAYERAIMYRMEWSDIVENILKLENVNISFHNFSSTIDKKISVRGEAKSLENIIIFLEQIKKEKLKIREPFISSVSPNGLGKYDFQLTFNLISS